MSYNNTIDIVNLHNGKVSGKLIRKRGTTGNIKAYPDQHYTFTKWISSDGSDYSTDNPLTVTNWRDMSITPVFEETVLTEQDFIDLDAKEAWAYALSLGVQSFVPSSHGTAYNSTTKYRFHGWSGPATRTHIDGYTLSAFPCQHVFNRGLLPDSEATAAGTATSLPRSYVRGYAKWDPVADPTGLSARNTDVTIGGQWSAPSNNPAGMLVVPTSGLYAWQISRQGTTTKLISPGGSWYAGGKAWPTRPGGFNFWDYSDPINTNFYHYSSYSQPSWGVTVTAGGEKPTQYPGAHLLGFGEFYPYAHPEYVDTRGMEKCDTIRFFHKSSYQNTNELHSNRFKNLDGCARWSQLRSMYMHDNYGLGWKDTPALSANKHNPRMYEFHNFSHSLDAHQVSHGSHGPSDLHPLSGNHTWQTDYQDVPNTGLGSILAGSNLSVWNIRQKTGFTNHWHFRHYYKNLRSYSSYRTIQSGSPAWQLVNYYSGRNANTSDWDFTGAGNLQVLAFNPDTGYQRLSSLDWLDTVTSTNLKYIFFKGLRLHCDIAPLNRLVARQKNLSRLAVTGDSASTPCVGSTRGGKRMGELPDELVITYLQVNSNSVEDLSRFNTTVNLHNVTIRPV